MAQDITDAKRGMERFLNSQALGQKVYYQPWYHVVNLVGFADAVTGRLSPQEIYFFQNSQGSIGSGFAGALTPSQTSLPVGANGVMPGGIEYIADHLGVDIFPSISPAVKTALTENSYLSQKRYSHNWTCGATRYWPAAEFGNQSLAASTTVANTTIEYGVNGRVPMMRLPAGAEIYFPAKQQIQFTITTTAEIFLTADGLPASDDNPVLDNAYIAVVMKGWQFEVITT